MPIELILTFNKMKALTQNVKKVAELHQDSKIVEISEDGLKIRKKGFNQRFVRIDDTGKLLPKYVKNKPTPKIYTQFENSE